MNHNPKTSVLVADPDLRARTEMSKILLREPDLSLMAEAESDCDFVTLASRLMPDVVVLDLVCDGSNHLAALRRLSQQVPGARVLISSVYNDSRYAAGIIAAGACGYLLKDRAAEELVEAVRAVAVGHIYVSSAVEGIERWNRTGSNSRSNGELVGTVQSQQVPVEVQK